MGHRARAGITYINPLPAAGLWVFRDSMDPAPEIIRLHEMYQTLLLNLGDEQRKNESLQRTLAEAQDQLDETSMDREILKREIDLQKDALVEQTRRIRMQDFTMVEAQRQLQVLAASNAERGQVILALHQCIRHPGSQEAIWDQGREKKRKVEDAEL